MVKLDRTARNVIKSIYSQFENASEIIVSSPTYKKTVIDYFVNQRLLERIDASSLSGWTYIIKPTYEGELIVSEIANLKSSKVETFIKQGEVIMNDEYHHVTDTGITDYISGPKSNQWFSEIKIFNDRFLAKHPLHDAIDTVCETHRQSFSAYEEMMGYLRALLADEELDSDFQKAETILSATHVDGKKVGKNMKKKYQVFISSTYKDLIEERAAVSQCLLDCGCIPVGMEQFPASGMSQMDYIKKMLLDCDYYILILAGRYGSLDSDGVGFTEKEYDYAQSIGLPVMSFVIENINKLQVEKCENNDNGRVQLESFRGKVLNNSLVRMYKNTDDLKASVAISLKKCIEDFPAVGWVRASATDSNDAIAKQVAEYLEKIAKAPRVKVEPNEDGGNTLVIY